MTPALTLDSQYVYRSPVLSNFSWLEHGFGTRLSEDWPGERVLTTVQQIHSNRVLIAEGQSGQVGIGDALLTDQPGIFLSIRTADCLPILIADPENRAVAAVHAGWRGTVAQICSNTVHEMERNFGSKRHHLLAVIGAGIAICCFEVGLEVARQFPGFEGRTRIDLEDVNYRQLIQAGLLPERIIKSGICTSCKGEMFYSYRRDGEAAGRSVAAIGIRI